MAVKDIREFNRFYTNLIGALDYSRHLHTPFTLTEARVLFELAHRECRALIEREPADCAEDVVHIRPVGLGSRNLRLAERDLVWTPHRAPHARAARVVGDRDQPVVRRVRLGAGLQRAIGVEERRLRDVLRFGRVPHHREDVAVHLADVAFVESLERAVWRVADEDRGHP